MSMLLDMVLFRSAQLLPSAMLLWRDRLSWCHKQMTFTRAFMTCSTSTFDALMIQTPTRSPGSMLTLPLAATTSPVVCTRTSSVLWLWGSQSSPAPLLHSWIDLRSTASPIRTFWMPGSAPCHHVCGWPCSVPWRRCVFCMFVVERIHALNYGGHRRWEGS